MGVSRFLVHNANFAVSLFRVILLKRKSMYWSPLWSQEFNEIIILALILWIAKIPHTLLIAWKQHLVNLALTFTSFKEFATALLIGFNIVKINASNFQTVKVSNIHWIHRFQMFYPTRIRAFYYKAGILLIFQIHRGNGLLKHYKAIS